MELDACWFADEEWRGFLLVEEVGELAERHVFVTHVAGLMYHPDALLEGRCGPGTPLWLMPEPANEFDPNAIAVWTADRAVQVGYVPRPVAADMPLIEGDRHGLVMSQLVDAGTVVALWIAVAREPLSLRRVSAGEHAARVRHRVATMKRHYRARTGLRERITSAGDPLEQMLRMAQQLVKQH